jgi:hypothetical protein
MASVYKLAGLEGIVCFFLFITSLSFWLLFKITENYSNQWITFGCVSLALAFSPSHMIARPHLFTWLFMLITLSILIAGEKRLYWLPVVMMIWANLHGGFILGLVLQTIFILGSGLDSQLSCKKSFREILQKQKTAIFALLSSLFIVGINPFGYELLLFPFQVSKGSFSTLIGEWQSPNLQEMWYIRFYLCALILLVSFAKSRATWTERLTIVFFINAALTHIRHISLMFIALTPVIVRMIDIHLSKYFDRPIECLDEKQLKLSAKTGPLLTVTIAVALLFLGSIDQRSLKFLAPESIFNVETVHLNQLVGYLDKNLPNGKMFNEYTLGGYLLFALNPAPKVFIDGRADMYGERILKDYNTIVTSSSEREHVLEKYDVDWVVFGKDSDLVYSLIKTGYWQKIYENEQYAVLIRDNQPPRYPPTQKE